MKEFPNEWCTDVCPEVVEWLNNKYNKGLSGSNKFYGERNNDEDSDFCDKFGTYISHEEFMELSGLAPKTVKVGDMVWVSDKSEENAIECKFEGELLAILPEDIDDRYICRSDTYPKQICSWKCVAPIIKEEKKERKLMLTDQEWEKLEKVYK